MTLSALRRRLVFGPLLLMSACGQPLPSSTDADDIAIISSARHVADRDLLVETAGDFFSKYPDHFDMLVVWGAPGLSPSGSYYRSIRNDVTGIGYQHEGPEFFDASEQFASGRLQGIIWMGPNWLTNQNDSGPTSVLGVLAQETAHRWASTIHFDPGDDKTTSDALLGSPYHWSFFLDTGASPLGGNSWEDLGNGTFLAEPVNHVAFSELDLYLMGLLPASDVSPLRLLVGVEGEQAEPATDYFAASRRASVPTTLGAEVVEVTIEQIIAAEGPRNTEAAFNATRIRQAWIYVFSDDDGATGDGMSEADGSVPHQLATLKSLQGQWGDYFSAATGGRSTLTTNLD